LSQSNGTILAFLVDGDVMVPGCNLGIGDIDAGREIADIELHLFTYVDQNSGVMACLGVLGCCDSLARGEYVDGCDYTAELDIVEGSGSQGFEVDGSRGGTSSTVLSS